MHSKPHETWQCNKYSSVHHEFLDLPAGQVPTITVTYNGVPKCLFNLARAVNVLRSSIDRSIDAIIASSARSFVSTFTFKSNSIHVEHCEVL